MDGRNFDDILRKLATGTSRRTVLRGLVGGALIAGNRLGLDRAEAARRGYSGPTKITICHFSPGDPSNVQVLRVSASAVSAYLAHGDYVFEDCCVDSDCADGMSSFCQGGVCTTNSGCSDGGDCASGNCCEGTCIPADGCCVADDCLTLAPEMCVGHDDDPWPNLCICNSPVCKINPHG